MYNGKVEPTTIQAIKISINGIKQISKERILSELYKILDLKNFINLNDVEHIKEIFSLTFPEFENFNRLVRLKKVYDHSKISRNILLAVLLIDKKDNHEYFSHKYNVSKDIREKLNTLAKDLKLLRENKDFFSKDLERNVYINNKNYLIDLNIINFTINSKCKIKDFTEILKNILQSKTHTFPYDGKYLIQNGMKQGSSLGKAMKAIEEEWINNSFKISEDRVKEIIKFNLN